MATNYPGAIDTYTNPLSSEPMNAPSHAGQHANANDAVEAIETELGTDPSGSAATVAARLDGIEDGTRLGAGSVGAAQLADNAVDTAAIQDGAVTAAKIADDTIVNADINASAAIAATKIAGTALVASTVDAKGDLYVGTANDTVARLAVGSNGAVLVADSAQTAGVRWTTARRLEGTGAPEGVVAAPPGSTFLQTDATTDVKGWIRWLKATGTGNTGWVAGPEADTGTRTIAVDGTNWSGNLVVRRIGPLVMWRSSGLAMASSAGVDAWTASALPAGFRPVTGMSFHAPTRNTSSGAISVLEIAATGVGTYRGTLTAGQSITFGASGPTADAWLSSLPGSAAP